MWLSQRKDKLLVILFFIMVLVAALTVFYVAEHKSPENGLARSCSIIDFSSGWTQFREDAAAVKGTGGNKGEWRRVTTLTRTIPENLGCRRTLCVETRQQALQVYVGKQLIFEAGVDQRSRFGRSMGSLWNFINIPEGAGGKAITLRLLAPLKQSPSKLQSAVLGSEGAVILYLIKKNLGAFLFACVVGLLGAALMAFGVLLQIKHINLDKRGFFYLGLFSMLSALWILTDSRILQLATANSAAVYTTSFLVFMLLPIPFLFYLKTAGRWEDWVLDLLCALFLLNFSVNLSLHAAGIADLAETVVFTHMLLLLTVGWIISVSVHSLRRGERGFHKEILPALCILCTFIVITTLWFYMERPGDYTRFYRWGLFCFIIALSIGTFRRMTALLREDEEIQTYKLLAYADTMTMLYNRTAFQKDTKKIREYGTDFSSVSLILFDLNDLKRTNDTEGHIAGDELIIRFAECLRGVFQGTGQAYRIGGDEFAVLINDRDEDELIALIGRLKEKSGINFAWGFERQVIAEKPDVDLRQMFRAADHKMYEEKSRCKGTVNERQA